MITIRVATTMLRRRTTSHTRSGVGLEFLAQGPYGDFLLKNLVGAFVDGRHPCVSEVPRRPVFQGVPVGTENLDRPVCGVEGGVRCEVLRLCDGKVGSVSHSDVGGVVFVLLLDKGRPE